MGGPLNVLVVDDDPLFARSLGRELEASGARVSLVRDLPAARLKLSAQSFDLIVLDYKLENADGPTLLETWPGETPLPPTIVLSGFVGIRETVRTMRAGAIDVLKKPASAQEIISRFRRAALETTTPSLHPTQSEGEEALIGQHPDIEAARRAITALASAPERHVMLVGESGTGKALMARAIHEATAQSNTFIPVNCAAIPEHFFEEELWGCPAAGEDQAELAQGLLSRAHGGTLFLDDVVAIPDPIQIRLLEIAQTGSYVVDRRRYRLGARIISSAEPRVNEPFAFHPTLKRMLGATTVYLPPLRERRVDIEMLANHFLERFAARHPGAPRRLTKNAVNVLLKHEWPGNVRELQGVVGHSAAMCESPELGGNLVQAVITNRTSPAHAGSGTRNAVGFRGSLPELERVAILQAFRASGNNVSEAARLVGLPRSTVRDKLKRYGIR